MSSSPAAPMDNLVVLHDEAAHRWLQFQHPIAVFSATRVEDVFPRLREVEQAVTQRGLHAAGWISYEAAPAFDPALAVRESGDFPLLWFGLYEQPAPVDLPPATEPLPAGWNADLSPDAYGCAFAQIKRHIRAGDTYQVNFTHRLLCDLFDRDPWQAFLALVNAQRARFGAYVAAGPWRVCSASPELFFRLDGTHLESRPMKGTAPRGLTSAQDRAQAEALLASAKNRAENLMIVDMVRNDLGRVARPGSVQTPEICALEKYPTLWQLTSTITAKTDVSVADIFTALFPPASITGAPKPRTMQIISELEGSPRRVYTGAIGFLSPGRRAQFNVAIRTLLVDTRTRRAEYGVGGGIVWDSDCAHEQVECRTKARILTDARPAFSLLETMLWTPESGFHLLERHLERLRESAEYFDYAFDGSRLRAELEQHVNNLPTGARRIRLMLAEEGDVILQSSPLPPSGLRAVPRVALARRPVDRANLFLYHKTTNRQLYDEAKADFPDHDDVILFNDAGEATESTVANLAVEIDGILYTPPVDCGLLPGTARAEFLAQGLLLEKPISRAQLLSRPRVFLFNSVRGLVPAVLDPPDEDFFAHKNNHCL